MHHAGGSTPITVNQQQNGGTWNYLGQFSFVPGSNHRVQVADSSSGTVVADAVRFVSAGVGGGSGLYYVHSDHLGTPQKMTDGSKVVVWDAVFKPFGETQSITGTVSNNQRFPGQYADAESGFSYNYFRDYDPRLGRYVESDPIGLNSGYNTYAYVHGNPPKFTDPFGLQAIPIPVPGPPIPFPPVIIPGTPGHKELADALEGAIEGIQDALGNLRNKIFSNGTPEGKGSYKCTSRCHLKKIKDCTNCPDFSGIGVGYGRSLAEAIINAEKSAKATAPKGCHARHCRPLKCWKNGRPIKLH